MKNYEKPIAEILMFRLAEVRMVTRKSYTPGNKARRRLAFQSSSAGDPVWIFHNRTDR